MVANTLYYALHIKENSFGVDERRSVKEINLPGL
jgi:hypothetical protein